MWMGFRYKLLNLNLSIKRTRSCIALIVSGLRLVFFVDTLHKFVDIKNKKCLCGQELVRILPFCNIVCFYTI